jgi:deoxyribose-phosphate aldolase
VSRRRRRETAVVTLTLAEARAVKGATGFGKDLATPREFAALDRALNKIERAEDIYRRSRRA